MEKKNKKFVPSQTFLGKWILKKISQKDVKRFCEENQTTEDEKVLIVHSDDMYYEYFFPTHKKAEREKKEGVSIKADTYYYKIDADSNFYDVVICTGLLEHVPEPQKTLNEINRVLKPGGKLALSASTSFSIHNAPENFFQFTTFGMEYLFKNAGNWKNIETKPSCAPFQTIAILLQRICFQTKMVPGARIIFLLLAKGIPVLDFLIKEQYGDGDKNSHYPVASMLYSNVQVVAYKGE